MSGRIEVPAEPIFFGTDSTSYKNDVKPEVDFSSILDGLKETADSLPKPYESFTGSDRTDKALKKAIWESISGGKDEAKEYFDRLKSEDQKTVISALKKLIDAIDKEMQGGSESGTVQELFNAIFGFREASASEEEATDEILLKILMEIKKLKGNATSDEALSALLPLMMEMNEETEAIVEEAYSVEEMTGTVAFAEDNTTYRLSLAQMREELSTLMYKLEGIEFTEDSGFIIDPDAGVQPPTSENLFPVTSEEDEFPGVEIPEVEIISPEETPAQPEGEAETAEQSLQTIILNNRMVKKEDELKELRAGFGAEITLNTVSAPYERIQNGVDMVSVQNQILESLTAQLSASRVQNSEFRMLLNPGSLGEIAVKIVNNGGEISVSIAAQSESTQRLLETRLSALVTGLQNVNDSVKEVRIVEAGENAAFAGFNLSSFTDGRGQGNQAQRGRAPQIKIVGNVSGTAKAEENSSEIYKGGNRLWQTV